MKTSILHDIQASRAIKTSKYPLRRMQRTESRISIRRPTMNCGHPRKLRPNSKLLVNKCCGPVRHGYQSPRPAQCQSHKQLSTETLRFRAASMEVERGLVLGMRCSMPDEHVVGVRAVKYCSMMPTVPRHLHDRRARTFDRRRTRTRHRRHEHRISPCRHRVHARRQPHRTPYPHHQ